MELEEDENVVEKYTRAMESIANVLQLDQLKQVGGASGWDQWVGQVGGISGWDRWVGSVGGAGGWDQWVGQVGRASG